MNPEDKKQLRLLWIVFGGFLTGVGLLFYIIATDL